MTSEDIKHQLIKRRCIRSGPDWHVSDWECRTPRLQWHHFRTHVLRTDAVLPLVFPAAAGTVKGSGRAAVYGSMSQAPQHQFQDWSSDSVSDWDWRGKSTDLAAAADGWVSGHWVQWVRADLSRCRRLCHPAPGGAGNSVSHWLSAVTSHKWLAAVSEDRKCWGAWNISTGPPQAAPPKAAAAKAPDWRGGPTLTTTNRRGAAGGREAWREKKTQRSSLKGDWPSLSNGHWNCFKSNTELGHFWETGWPGRITSIPSAQALWPSFCFRLWEFFKINIHRAYCK